MPIDTILDPDSSRAQYLRRLWCQVPSLTTPRAVTSWVRSAALRATWTRDQAICPDSDFFAELSTLQPAHTRQMISAFSVVHERQKAICDVIGIASLPMFIGLLVMITGDDDGLYNSVLLLAILAYIVIYITTRQILAQTTIFFNAIARHEACATSATNVTRGAQGLSELP